MSGFDSQTGRLIGICFIFFCQCSNPPEKPMTPTVLSLRSLSVIVPLVTVEYVAPEPLVVCCQPLFPWWSSVGPFNSPPRLPPGPMLGA